jgi:hypothetical protein
LAALERLFRPPPSLDQLEVERLARWLSFEEIEAGQQALEAFDGDPLRALEAADPVFSILIEVARSRRDGAPVPPLFVSEAQA